ncbi:helix-turn-helix domain-containing protein [Streptomyces sp. NPDC053541]|uniref:helix-turn-helix domain-containing protein n=1 Tax=Streptomyces sp. NPDC053541 TaxID=3365709 RepID=UPI0037D5B16A
MRIRGDRLRSLRESRGWTQAYVASQVGCSRTAVISWETQGITPSPVRLQILANLFEVDSVFLISGDCGSPLRFLRRSAGLLQRDVAKSLNVGVSTYSDVETGRQGIPDRWVPILSFVFRVPPSVIRSLCRLSGDEMPEGAADWSAPSAVLIEHPSESPRIRGRGLSVRNLE